MVIDLWVVIAWSSFISFLCAVVTSLGSHYYPTNEEVTTIFTFLLVAFLLLVVLFIRGIAIGYVTFSY